MSENKYKQALATDYNPHHDDKGRFGNAEGSAKGGKYVPNKALKEKNSRIAEHAKTQGLAMGAKSHAEAKGKAKGEKAKETEAKKGRIAEHAKVHQSELDNGKGKATVEKVSDPNAVHNVVQEFNSFNDRRYGNPWGARVTLDAEGKPAYNFKVANHYPEGGKGSASEVHVSAKEGHIVAFGQKDFRGKNTGNDWYKVGKGGELTPTNRLAAVKYLKSQS